MSEQTTEAAEPPEAEAGTTSGEATADTASEATRTDLAAAECRECGATIRGGVAFCPTCGTTQKPQREAPEPAPVAEGRPEAAQIDVPPVAAAPVARSTPAPALARATTPGMQSFLLPRFPFKLVWSPRKAWVVSTRLPEREIADAFSTTMAKEASVLRRSNNYYRRVSWTTQRNAISGEVVATCRADGPVTVGAGRSKIYADVSGDTLVCRIDRNDADGRNHVSIGVGTFTTWLGFYLFPPMAYSMDVIKALRRADPTVQVRHPWSVVRIVALVAFVIFLIAS